MNAIRLSQLSTCLPPGVAPGAESVTGIYIYINIYTVQPEILAVKFKSLKCDLRIGYFTRARARNYMHGTTAKFKSASIFISPARDQTAKFKDRQYFRLYGICIR